MPTNGNGSLAVVSESCYPFISGVADLRLPPSFTTLYPQQLDAINEALDLYADGCDVVFLDGPTGTGKTVIGEAIRQGLGVKGMYVCSGIELQHQMARDFPYARVLKGRANYPTQLRPYPAVTCADCVGQAGVDGSCTWCESMTACAYTTAKREAMGADLAILNTAYFLAEANHAGRMRRELVIADECDTLESQLMGFVEFNVSERVCRELGVEAPRKGVHKETIARWLVDELRPGLASALKVAGWGNDVDAVRKKERYGRLIQDIDRVVLTIHDDNWVRDNDAGPMVLKPVRVDGWGREMLWRHGDKWLCMSATIVSVDEMVDSLGCGRAVMGTDAMGGEMVIAEPMKVGVVRVPMLFPVENRRINIVPLANMIKAEMDTAVPIVIEGVKKVLRLHPGEKVLVHSVSYKLTKEIVEGLRGVDGWEVCSYYNAAGRTGALKAFKEAVGGAVLVAPSMDRGIDLPGDLCRVVVVAKLPFPYIGDRQVSARMRGRGGDLWYQVQTVRSLVQMTGRHVRGMDDWGVTYVLDAQMEKKLWKGGGRRLLPDWWRAAAKVMGLREWKGLEE